MRILFLSSVFPQPYEPTRGIYCLHLCRAFAAQHDVRAICPRPWLEQLWHRHEPWPDGGKLLGEVAVDYPTYYYPPGVLSSASGWFMWTSVRRTVRRVLSEFRPEAVVSYWAHPDGAVAARAAREAGVPSAVIVGGSDVLILPRSPGRRRKVIAALQATDAVITVGQDLKARVEELSIPPRKVHVVLQGVNRHVFYPGNKAEARRRLGLSESGQVLLWVGRMVPVKGLDVLLQACTQMRRRGIDFNLHLVGDGPLRKGLEGQVEKLGLAEMVSFAGSVGQEQLADWYRAADLTLLPSLSEGIPNVLRESLACGTPFVASDVGGIAELERDAVSRLVPAGNAALLAEAICSGLIEAQHGFGVPIRARGWEESAEELIHILTTLRSPRCVHSPVLAHF